MNIIRKNPDKYGLQKAGKNCHRIVKILREYDDEQQAINNLTELLTGEITEEELVSGGLKHMKTVETYFDGKLENRVNILEAALEGIRESLVHAMGDNDSLEKAARDAVKRINELVEG